VRNVEEKEGLRSLRGRDEVRGRRKDAKQTKNRAVQKTRGKRLLIGT